MGCIAMDMKAAYTSADIDPGENLGVMIHQAMLMPTVSRVCNVKRVNPMNVYIYNIFILVQQVKISVEE